MVYTDKYFTQFAGVSNSSTLYKRGIRVCTGTGLGASLSTCLQESFYQVSDRSYLPAVNRSQSPDWWFMATTYCSHVLSECSRYLIWIGSDQEKTFGPTISSLIKRNLGPERMTLWDSKKRGMINEWFWIDCCMSVHYFVVGGRPDVMKLIREAYQSWGAEVVFITTNLQGNRQMMEDCKLEGIPAFVRFFLVYNRVFSEFYPGNALGLLTWFQNLWYFYFFYLVVSKS